MVALSMILQE